MVSTNIHIIQLHRLEADLLRSIVRLIVNLNRCRLRKFHLRICCYYVIVCHVIGVDGGDGCRSHLICVRRWYCIEIMNFQRPHLITERTIFNRLEKESWILCDESSWIEFRVVFLDQLLTLAFAVAIAFAFSSSSEKAGRRSSRPWYL